MGVTGEKLEIRLPEKYIDWSFDNNKESVTKAVYSSVYKVKKGNKNKGIEKHEKDKEFEYLKDLIDYNQKYLTRLLPDNDFCRYNNIRCYKDNYVEVSTPHKAINASWIHIPLERSFICSQAPLRNTIDDFWAMCFDYDVKIIIMLCKLVENGKEKCVEYWEPEKKELYASATDQEIFNFSVTYTSEEINEDIIIRTCHVLNKATNVKKEIKQIHYGGWPDHEIPENLQIVYGNMLFIFNILDNEIGHNPVCVHCSAGIGRTGTFIALYNIYKQILFQINNKNFKSISFSLMNIVRKLKEMRLYLVENDKQYKMIYQFISKLLKDRN